MKYLIRFLLITSYDPKSPKFCIIFSSYLEGRIALLKLAWTAIWSLLVI